MTAATTIAASMMALTRGGVSNGRESSAPS